MSLTRVSGGFLNDAYRAELEDGRSVFVKTGGGGYPDEAAGLRWLGEVPGAPPVPGVVAVADTFLALE
ncbi:MAG: hypothetical protein J2O48_13925, partial [Solirubrobacterales bacterium]|nr:hypothetical protein [Solirubrobacterales bacterium]